MTNAAQVIALDGLDDAIIGTCNQMGGGEVIAYDYNKVVELFESMDWDEDEFGEWWDIMSESIPPDAYPVFVNLDDSVRYEIAAQRNGCH